ncbi:MAG: pimeloyl-ACP methyl ester carboxylesterase/membrane protein DedA with SNARE-associated domain [Planctomycetota bacterium]|jgi:pimeloyl-ACP methyl ester carboxylesterase/membrane protein DedA with SNARE-associated domain
MSSIDSHGASKVKRFPRLRRLAGGLALIWLVLLIASHFRRLSSPWEPTFGEGERTVLVPWDSGPETGALERPDVRIALRDIGDAADPVPVVLLHGSPGSGSNFRRLAQLLPPERRLLLVDLPGFGASELELPDYSIRTHARLLRNLLDELGVSSAHIVGYSMGGGVALELCQLEAKRVASLTLLSSIGVQELELFGDYGVNHAIHGAQVLGLWLAHELMPHFGAFDGGMLSVQYARNFFDSDQRPLREALLEWRGPTLILHGRKDSLAPFGVAQESARLVPQAQLVPFDSGHMLVFSEPELLADPLGAFWSRVESGQALLREGSAPELLARSRAPFDPSSIPPLAGIGLLVFVLIAGLSTLVSEDLTCVAVGALVGQGRVGLAVGALACFLGIYIGDLLLFLAGRFFGRRAVHRAPLKWFLSEARVERSSVWFQSKGAAVIFLSRFLPGARLPTYFAAGMLRTRFLSFALWFAIAAGLWTPVVVWLSSLLSGSLAERVEFLRNNGFLGLVLTVSIGVLSMKVLVPMTSHKGRRMLLGAWRRKTRWEYWPPWLVYPPVVVAALFEGLRQGRLLAFTASNPGIAHAGFVGESKVEILRAFAGAGDRLPPWEHLVLGSSESTIAAALARLQGSAGQTWPVIVKPDVGQRGDGVTLTHSEAEVLEAVAGLSCDSILQAYVPGHEYGLFWARNPEDPEGSLISVVDKRLPFVKGDGVRNLEELILDDERAVAMAPFFLDRNASRLGTVPADGEEVSIGDLGTHCKGALFLDGNHLVTPELTRAVAEVAEAFSDERWDSTLGFAFGRLDVRALGEEELRAGRFGIIEVNGVTSEAAHVYDPRHGVTVGWRTLAAQWRMAQRIGAAQARAGAPVSTTGDLLNAVLSWRRTLAGAYSGRGTGKA